TARERLTQGSPLDDSAGRRRGGRLKLQDHVALITGASHGLGLAIAHALAMEGTAISCVARPGEALDRAVASLHAGGTRVIAAAADVTVETEIEAAVRKTGETWGRLDILVLNAGTWMGAPIRETSESMWDAVL